MGQFQKVLSGLTNSANQNPAKLQPLKLPCFRFHVTNVVIPTNCVTLERAVVLRSTQCKKWGSSTIWNENIREQSSAPDWHRLRKQMLTTSHFKEICTRKENFESLSQRLINGKIINTASVRHVITHEDEAAQPYSQVSGNGILPVGLIINPSIPHLGCSPDKRVYNVCTFIWTEILEARWSGAKVLFKKEPCLLLSGYGLSGAFRLWVGGFSCSVHWEWRIPFRENIIWLCLLFWNADSAEYVSFQFSFAILGATLIFIVQTVCFEVLNPTGMQTICWIISHEMWHFLSMVI